MDKLFCVQCESVKHAFEFDRKGEHILPYGFGNDGNTDAILKYKICHACNQRYGNAIDKPFLRHVVSREIQHTHNMKRRHSGADLKITGSGVSVRYRTSIAHLWECIKIAFETHIKFLSEEYRDDTFYTIRGLLQSVVADYDRLRSSLKNQPHGRSLDEVWAETSQGVVTSKCFHPISENVYRLDEVTSNPAEIIEEIASRSGGHSYASLIQLGYWNFGVAVMVCLQSLPPIVVRVCNQTEQYGREYGCNCKFIMDLKSTEKWIGRERF